MIVMSNIVKKFLDICDITFIKFQAIIYIVFMIGLITGIIGASLNNDTMLYTGTGLILFVMLLSLVSQIVDSLKNMMNK